MNIKFFSTMGYDFYAGEGASETEYIGLPICQPEMDQEEVGRVTMSIDGLYAPGISTDAITIGAPIMRVFSAPQNL